jgi:hypothetical protein
VRTGQWNRTGHSPSVQLKVPASDQRPKPITLGKVFSDSAA